MTRTEFLQVFTQCLQQETSPLTGDEQLESLAGWDSLAVVIFMAELDRTWGTSVPPAKIKQAKTVNDLYAHIVNLTKEPAPQA